MLYITYTRLMRESESSVHEHAESGDGHSRSACIQLISNQPRYSQWMSRHDRAMHGVANAKRRERQLTGLRGIAVQQIHSAALVRHLRANEITGPERDLLLRVFYGPLDAACSVLTEHRNYILAASSQICASDLLELSGDRHGCALIDRYQRDFGLYFAMYCDQAHAEQTGRYYLFDGLIPEIRAEASRTREQLLGGDRLPAPKLRISRKPQSAKR